MICTHIIFYKIIHYYHYYCFKERIKTLCCVFHFLTEMTKHAKT